MKSSSESGHVMNVANFERLVDKCESCGSTYNPSIPQLGLESLKTSAVAGRGALSTYNVAQAPHIMAINDRDALFKPLNKKCTKIINALVACKASSALVKDARTVVNKIQGRRATGKSEDKKSISASQTSFDFRVNNFDRLIQILEATPEYAPNEADLSVASLKAYKESMLKSIEDANKANTNLNKLRMERNKVLYDEQTGLVAMAKTIKAYFKSIYGTNHPQYKEVSGIQFRTYKK